MKPLALYLPQYHRVKENDEWWGEGYTEWTAVKNAVPISKKQIQPRVPLDDNYYDLSDETGKAWKWQAELAREYGIYGFVIYHYWFETGKQLLEKPVEILLSHPEIDTHFCICWANESWRRGWYSTSPELLMEQKYGDQKEYENHFEYLLRLFNDPRYIRVDGKPMVCIYHPAEIDGLPEMVSVWQSLAIKNGFPGLHIVGGNTGSKLDNREQLFDAYYNFEPSYSISHKYKKIERLSYLVNVFIRSMWNKISTCKTVERPIDGRRFIEKMKRPDMQKQTTIYPGAFPQWDNTPRRNETGTVFFNMDKDVFRKQLKNAKKDYPDSEFIFINAWNEWGEGAYLEPDSTQKYDYLTAIKDEFRD